MRESTPTPSHTEELPHPSLAPHHSGGFASLVSDTFSDISELPGLTDAFMSTEPSEAGGEFFEPEEEDRDIEEEIWHDFELDFGDLLRPEARKAALVTLRERLKALATPRKIILADKITFTIGTIDLFVSAYWLGCSPETFYKLYSVKVVVLLLLRWIYYRSTRQHYYFFDLCYFSQILLLVQLHIFPTSIAMAKLTFAFSLGPLLWSIVAFRNSLVYHSLDKVTSLFLHWFPAVVCFAFRWNPPQSMAEMLKKDSAARAQWETATPWELCFLPMGPYVCWAILYYLKVFVISSKKISEKGYETLFSWLTSKKSGLFASIVLRFPRGLQPVVYLGVHMGLTQTAMSLNVVWWGNKTACSIVVLAAFAMAAWNGACFYFEVFVHRYLAGLGLEPRRQPSRSPASPATPAGTPAPSTAAVVAAQTTDRPKAE